MMKSELMEFIDQKIRLINISNQKTTMDENIEAHLSQEIEKQTAGGYQYSSL